MGGAAGVRFLAEARHFSQILIVQTGTGAHPVAYIMGTGGSFPKVKRPGPEADL
jgi:hypothetical protein